MTYPNTQLFINGQWQDAADGRSLPVFNPATGKEIGRLALAGKADLDKALEAAQNQHAAVQQTCRCPVCNSTKFNLKN